MSENGSNEGVGGSGIQRLADEAGISYSGMWKRLHPERTKEYNRAENAGSQRQAEKNAWDRAHTLPCACGQQRCRHSTQCLDCHRRDERGRVDARRSEIQKLWSEGASLNEIAAALNTTRASVGVECHRMRAAGWELPYRNPGYSKAAA